jgi:hypothetical protein
MLPPFPPVINSHDSGVDSNSPSGLLQEPGAISLNVVQYSASLSCFALTIRMTHNRMVENGQQCAVAISADSDDGCLILMQGEPSIGRFRLIWCSAVMNTYLEKAEHDTSIITCRISMDETLSHDRDDIVARFIMFQIQFPPSSVTSIDSSCC